MYYKWDELYNSRFDEDWGREAVELQHRLNQATAQYGGDAELRRRVTYQDFERMCDRVVPHFEWTVSGTGLTRLLDHLEEFKDLRGRTEYEHSIRNRSPSAQKAWEQYQLIIALEGGQ